MKRNIQSVFSSAFDRYGQVVEGLGAERLLEALKKNGKAGAGRHLCAV